MPAGQVAAYNGSAAWYYMAFVIVLNPPRSNPDCIQLSLQVRGQVVKLNPFPPGSLGQCFRRLVQLLIWLCWGGFLGLSLILPLSGSDNKPLVQLFLRHKKGAVVQNLEAVVTVFWMVPALAHIVSLWGFGLLCQRYGYTASLRDLQYLLCRHCSKRPRGKGASAACSSDPKIDALFFPARNLRTDKRRARVNAAIWVAVVAIKVAFEFFFVILPLVHLMQKVGSWFVTHRSSFWMLRGPCC